MRSKLYGGNVPYERCVTVSGAAILRDQCHLERGCSFGARSRSGSNASEPRHSSLPVPVRIGRRDTLLTNRLSTASRWNLRSGLRLRDGSCGPMTAIDAQGVNVEQ